MRWFLKGAADSGMGAASVRAVRCLIVPVTFVLLAAASSCGEGETKTVTVTETVTSEQPATPTETEQSTEDNDLRQPLTSGGITVNVLGVRAGQTLRYEGGTQSDVTPDAEPRIVKAKQDRRYVYIKSRLTNDTSSGIDLTCGYAVDAKAIDEKDRQFDAVEGLSQLRGNPGCNEMLQPGLNTSMMWVYLVPSSATVTAFAFADVTDVNAPAEPDVALLPPTPK
jgi:hypothetical protein